ncbi:MAG: tRNA dihydrouridine synthase DusB [Desulfamplus sp.]|nr:tRNA dihydrouridine synthase DusB [Desulfamplus sp.]MBF0388715.1 tRNA dihydrouridine synthase DusB [Desulfamplus sp.]
MDIGSLKLDGFTALAPLAGISNLPFRRIVKRCGCSLVYSEMVSVKGLLYNSDKTYSLLQSSIEEKPLSVQIFGSDPKEMAQAAAIIEKLTFNQNPSVKVADTIDINFGCSVKKVIKSGAGVALMQNVANAENILKAVRDAISIPLTIKIRSGWDSSGKDAFKIAEIAQKCKVDAIAFHPRVASQGFRGKADWSLIGKLKANLSIPLIGNGDILSADDGIAMMEMTGCDGVMVGRGAMADPFILSDIEKIKSVGKLEQNRSLEEIFSVMKGLLISSVEHFGELPACKMMRSRLVWFIKGYPECSKFRRALTNIESMSQAIDIINEYQSFINNLNRQ